MLGFAVIVAGVISLILASMVLLGGASAKQSKWPFIGFATSVGVWAIGIGVFSLSSNLKLATFVVYVYYIAALFIAYALMVFCINYSSRVISLKVASIALVPWVLVSLLVYPLDLLIISVDISSRAVALAPITYALYAAVFLSYTIVALVALWRQSIQQHARTYRLLAYTLTICLCGGGFFNLFLPGLGLYEYVAIGPLFTFLMVAAVFYAIARHGLFDVRFAAVRTVAYALALATLVGIYMVVIYVLIRIFGGTQLGNGQLFADVLLMLVLAFLFQPLKSFFDKVTNRVFYKDNYSMSSFIARINRALNSTNDLRVLLERTATVIASTLKAEQVVTLIFTDEDGHYVTAGTERHSHVVAKEFTVFDELLDESRDVILLHELEPAHMAYRMMVSHRLQVVLPLYKNTILTGYLCLGEHKSFTYSIRDVRAIQTIADELIIAAQNALAVDEVRQLNDTLEQRISSATKELRRSNAQLQRLDEAKDEFISMASHQLRTPLTSIKGYISMLLEGDVGKISKDQAQVLNEAFISSERMVRLIGDFLNVSRLQTGKFVIEKHPIDLGLLVQREVDGLAQNAGARGMRFVYKRPANLPLLSLDENKIQQVVMNFCDNAIYYSKDNSTITVSLQKVGDSVEFKVTDTGIGVPKADQAHLFTKFYRGTNARRARPDGTGVGLFLAKKVIDDHGGKIIFHSKENQGSTFGFRLPLGATEQ